MHLFDLLDVAPQAQAAINVAVDPAKLILAGVVAMGSVLLTVVGFVAKALFAKANEAVATISATAVTVQRIDHELFGPTGENGMRSDLRRVSLQQNLHHDFLVQLADKVDLDPPERAQ